MERIETQRKKGGRAATQAWENLGLNLNALSDYPQLDTNPEHEG